MYTWAKGQGSIQPIDSHVLCKEFLTPFFKSFQGPKEKLDVHTPAGQLAASICQNLQRVV